MPFILYYSPVDDAIEQWFVPPGTPLDEASTLGIVEMSLNEFVGVEFAAASPPPPDWNYN